MSIAEGPATRNAARGNQPARTNPPLFSDGEDDSMDDPGYARFSQAQAQLSSSSAKLKLSSAQLSSSSAKLKLS